MITNNRSDYLPNENGNGNRNGHTPPFRLAPPLNPEEEARNEVLREIAPKIRRKIREDSDLSAGAKFFFYALFDDCFWHAVGGHGTGQIFADIRTLSERYFHDEKSIGRWQKELVKGGWLWTNYEWPMTEWRLTPLMAPPISAPAKRAVQMSLGKAVVGVSPTTSKNGKNHNKPKVSGGGGDANGQKDRRSPPKCPSPVGVLPVARGQNGGKVVGETPTSVGHNAHGVPPKCPRASGETPTSDRQDAHERSEGCPTPPGKSAHPIEPNASREKTPGVGSFGDHGGEQTAPPSGSVDPEKISWNGRNWWPSQLHKQLALLDGAIASTSGDERKRAKELRTSLLVALGVPVASAKTIGSAVPSKASGPAPSPQQISNYIAAMRAAVK